MKPHKGGQVVNDQSARPNDPITGTEHDFTGKLEDWEDRVFKAAIKSGHFTVCRRSGVGQVQRKEYRYFSQAALAAWHDPRLLVYAVTDKGRFICLIRDRWQHYLDMQRELIKV